MLPDLQIIENFLDADELAYWQQRVQTGEPSVSLYLPDVQNTQLYQKCRDLVQAPPHDLPLIHLILLNVTADTYTEMHQDVGEYSTIFFPFTNLNAPLALEDSSIDVIENRLVMLNVTKFRHLQVKPTDGSTRYSIALKWNILSLLGG